MKTSLVERVGVAWVHLYTSGLPDDVRVRRRDEITSDLYEQSRAALIAGRQTFESQNVASRFVRGAPADVSWRIGHELQTHDRDDLSASWAGRIALFFILGLAVASLVYAILHAFKYFPEEPRYYAFVQLGLMVGCLVMLGGFSTSKRAPIRGAAQILVTGLLMALMWAFILPVAIGILIVTGFGLYRAFRFARANKRREVDVSTRPPSMSDPG